ncbi:unnamed protein product [Rotaria socialis]|nr:unnamed protein product [Rotaria socialis]CAF3466719.1 unnamed protein product [Rotaria socialis]CAF4111522.1 unnamed protein product [Rotaria socialis]CAF4383752.1 unnamed protein product [Rotaria socialis]CAF4553558.1 unnamed protein product [Rotaria socialis]
MESSESSSVEYNRIEKPSNYMVYNITPTFVKIEQLKTMYSADHQHEVHALSELNERFRSMLDYIYQLETQNSKYISKLIELRRKVFLASVNGKLSTELTDLHADVREVSYAKISYESEFELFQVQSKMYQQMAQFGQPSVDQGRVKLEQELNQSGSTLANLRTSYASMEQTVVGLRANLKDTLRQYMALTKEWSSLKKQTKELKCSLQVINIQIQFSKTIYSKADFFTMDMDDFAEFWKAEWAQIINRVHSDFEILYGAIYQESVSHYEKKSKEMQVELERLVNIEREERVEYGQVLVTLEAEYEEVQKVHSQQRGLLMKAEATYSELESEYKALQIQYQDKFEAQSKEIECLNENIIVIVSNVEEVQRRKICLEGEIIVYRHMLGKTETKKTIETSIKKTRTYVEKNQYVGPISIECPLESTYIAVINQSTNAVIDISRWRLARRVDATVTLQYTIPTGVQVNPGRELRVYSKFGNEVSQLSSSESSFSSLIYDKLILNDIYSLGIGETIETVVLDDRDNEVASCLQQAESDWTE